MLQDHQLLLFSWLQIVFAMNQTVGQNIPVQKFHKKTLTSKLQKE